MSSEPGRQPEQIDVLNRRADFPALDQQIHGQPLVYLDSAASSQVPQVVIDTMRDYQATSHANVHRGVHTLSHRATDAYEKSRDDIATFIGAASRQEVVFTSGTTEGINLVAQSFARPRLAEGKRILLTELEHHSNIVPWQIVAEQTGATLDVVPILDDGSIDLDYLMKALEAKPVVLAIAYVSNALGTIIPLEVVIEAAHAQGTTVVVDGAQAVPHLPVDVQALGCDFFAFSGHKMFGPTGTGILFGKESLLDAMPPYQGGGDMILEVSFDGTTYNDLPYKFEAGTPNIASFVGLGAAVRYLQDIGMDLIKLHEDRLLDYMMTRLSGVEGIRLFGTAPQKASVQSFLLGDIHPHDLGTILDHQGIAIRTGHHCAMPVMQHFGIPGTARASLALYNNADDVDRLIAGLEKAREIFA